MGTIIAARKPFIKTKNAENIYYNIDTYPVETPGERKSYTVSKSSYEVGVAQDLKIDLSAFVFPHFSSTPQTTFPVNIADASTGTEIGLELQSIDPTEYYNAFYGWEDFNDDTLGLATVLSERCVTIDSKQYITANLFSTTNLIWRTNTGKIINITNTSVGVSKASVFPVVLPALGVDENDAKITIEAKDGSTTLWTLTYHIACAWEESVTIAFINRFGVWETFDCLGRTTMTAEFDKESFLSSITGAKKTIGATGSRALVLNTGWVDEPFYDVLEDMMLSESIVVYTGDSKTYYLEQDNKTLTKLTSRSDGMMNYELKFNQANPIIPTV